jgi:hypothetical protein
MPRSCERKRFYRPSGIARNHWNSAGSLPGRKFPADRSHVLVWMCDAWKSKGPQWRPDCFSSHTLSSAQLISRLGRARGKKENVNSVKELLAHLAELRRRRTSVVDVRGACRWWGRVVGRARPRRRNSLVIVGMLKIRYLRM